MPPSLPGSRSNPMQPPERCPQRAPLGRLTPATTRDRDCDMSQLIPLTVLFGNPERVSPRLSPDGSQLAWIAPHEGVLNVWLAPVSAGGGGVDWAAAQVVTDDTDRGIRQFAWAHNGHHLLYL